MFTGWSAHNLDVKGRVAIPARFRDVLKTKSDERVVVTTGEPLPGGLPLRGLADHRREDRPPVPGGPPVLAFRAIL